jgi:hypothetical protein
MMFALGPVLTDTRSLAKQPKLENFTEDFVVVDAGYVQGGACWVHIRDADMTYELEQVVTLRHLDCQVWRLGVHLRGRFRHSLMEGFAEVAYQDAKGKWQVLQYKIISEYR